MSQLLTIKLSKPDGSPWGFRLQGGKDFATPLCIQKVNVGSVAEKAGLMAGDAIVSIGASDALPMRHKEAQEAIIRAGSHFDLVIQRGSQTWKPQVTPLPEPKTTPDGVTVATKTSLAAPHKEHVRVGSGHNTVAVPFGEVNGQAIVNAQYNTPLGLYSEDAIAETLSAQAEVLGKGVLGINFKKFEREVKLRVDSPTYKLIHGADDFDKGPKPHQLPPQEAAPPPPAPVTKLPGQQDGHTHDTRLGPAGTHSVRAPQTKVKSVVTNGTAEPVTKCSECERPLIGVFVRIKNKNLHADCFRCATCGSSLKNVGYYNINEKLYCDVHAKQAAKHHPPAPNMEPVTVKSGALPPFGAMTAAQVLPKAVPPPAPSPPIEVPQPEVEPQPEIIAPPPPPPPPPVAEPVYVPPEPEPVPEPEPQPEPVIEPPPPAPKPVQMYAPPPAPPAEPVQAPAPPPPPAAVASPTFTPVPSKLIAQAQPSTLYGGGGGIDVKSHIPKKGPEFMPAPAPALAPLAPPSVPTAPPSRGSATSGQRSAPRRGRGIMNPASGSRIPMCATCQRQIRGPFVSALGKTWCPDHFICGTESCRKPLIEMGFVEEQGILYCEHCYEQFLAPICGKCDKRIKGDCLNAVSKQFHPECFCCAYCGKVFGSGAFYLEDGLPYCEADWNDLFTTKCVGCSFPIEAGDRWVEALNNNYHSQCFKCSKCHKNLEGQSFFAKGGKPFCKAHAQRGF